MKFILLFSFILLIQTGIAQTKPIGIFQFNKDIGNPKITGSAQYDKPGKVYTLKGSGYNIWFERDELNYLFNKISGDFVLTANFEFVGKGTDPHRKIGWMVRASEDDNAQHATAVVHGDGLTVLQWRETKGAIMRDPQDEIFAPKANYQIIQLERKGKELIMRAAHVGEPLQLIGSHVLVGLPNEVLAGLFICSHNPTVLEEARITNVRIETAKTSGQTGVGVKCPKGAMLYFDGTAEMLHKNWEYWKGPRFSTELPIKWEIVADPINGGSAVSSNDPAGAGGKYGAADIVTRQKFRDFRLHVEFLVSKNGGNSGVYLQNRYEIQILDGDSTAHGMAAVINEEASPYSAYNGTGKWNAYDIVFRAARFKDGIKVKSPMVTMYFNGKKVHTNKSISQVWGGPNSGIDGGNDGGKGITDTPGGIKLQAEGHEVLFRNVWIKKLDLKKADTDLKF